MSEHKIIPHPWEYADSNGDNYGLRICQFCGVEVSETHCTEETYKNCICLIERLIQERLAAKRADDTEAEIPGPHSAGR